MLKFAYAKVNWHNKKMRPPFLETKRLILLPPDINDLDDLFTLQSDPQVMKYIGLGVRTIDEVKVRLVKAISHYSKHGFGLGTVREKNTGNFIGRAGLIHFAYNDSQSDIEIGYALLKNYWGQGYATELTQGLMRWGFDYLSCPLLFAITHPNNHSSQHVLKKSGMLYLKPTIYWEREVLLFGCKKNTQQ